MTTQEVMQKLLEYSGLNAQQFATAAGIRTKQSVYDLQKGRTRSFSPDMASKVVAAFPEISKAWLMTGEGDMLVSGAERKKVNAPTSLPGVSDIKMRLISYINEKGITATEFALGAGLSANFVISMRSSIQRKSLDKIAKAYPDLNMTWLMTGSGSMIREDAPKAVEPTIEPSAKEMNVEPVTQPEETPKGAVMLYDTLAAANTSHGFSGDINQPLGMVFFPGMPECDNCVLAWGDSMYPVYKNGDIIGIKFLPKGRPSFLWGEAYVINFVDSNGEDMLVIKYVKKSEKGDDYIKLVSENDFYDPIDISLASIRYSARVKWSIHLNARR